jgi:uncharacterized membrane protein (UPF0127 family)
MNGAPSAAPSTPSAEPSPLGVIRGSSGQAMAPSADAGETATSPVPDAAASDAATSDGDSGPSCVQPTPASPPPAVSAVPAAECPPDPGDDPNGPTVSVVFPQAGGAVVQAELVTSQQDLERGLMYRTSLPEDQGMLFDMGSIGNYQVWMHDTCIPLDMILADTDGWIVGIIENAPPLDDTLRSISCPWRYMLEVNAGWSRAHGVQAGQSMTSSAIAQ